MPNVASLVTGTSVGKHGIYGDVIFDRETWTEALADPRAMGVSSAVVELSHRMPLALYTNSPRLYDFVADGRRDRSAARAPHPTSFAAGVNEAIDPDDLRLDAERETMAGPGAGAAIDDGDLVAAATLDFLGAASKAHLGLVVTDGGVLCKGEPASERVLALMAKLDAAVAGARAAGTEVVLTGLYASTIKSGYDHTPQVTDLSEVLLRDAGLDRDRAMVVTPEAAGEHLASFAQVFLSPSARGDGDLEARAHAALNAAPGVISVLRGDRLAAMLGRPGDPGAVGDFGVIGLATVFADGSGDERGSAEAPSPFRGAAGLDPMQQILNASYRGGGGIDAPAVPLLTSFPLGYEAEKRLNTGSMWLHHVLAATLNS